jgi:hypothetical protein
MPRESTARRAELFDAIRSKRGKWVTAEYLARLLMLPRKAVVADLHRMARVTTELELTTLLHAIPTEFGRERRVRTIRLLGARWRREHGNNG